jgi:factor associated with neutral sphingomyelinase activation
VCVCVLCVDYHPYYKTTMLGGKFQTFRRRFNLLLLEEREYYFEDYGAHLMPRDAMPAAAAAAAADSKQNVLVVGKPLKGRIHVCSRSLVFDPDESLYPVVRLPFRSIKNICTPNTEASASHSSSTSTSSTGGAASTFKVNTASVVTMRPNGFHQPYTFTKVCLSVFYDLLLFVFVGCIV